ncbi:hypothetical protein GGR53DRAFT_98167 [Hypoxylon sp. FL1150]|nr:hypothetical protein GGR53DRAFT_98167 [Hypoxylon sp. FL1150]
MVSRTMADPEIGGFDITPPVYRGPIKRCINAARTALPFLVPSFSRGQCEKSLPRVQIEDHPDGYPQFSALIASHESFYICRRFDHLRARLLLLKQDRLSILEQKLRKIDREEKKPLRRGSSRRDNNEARQGALADIDAALADYDTFVERSRAMFSLELATKRNSKNLRNWIDGDKNVAREEAAFLSCSEDLVSVANTDDTVMTWLELLIEDIIFYMRRRLGEKRANSISRDLDVHIMAKSTIARITRIVMTPIIITLLLAPVIICNILSSLLARLCVVVAATTLFVAVLSGTTKAKTYDLVVAGATYVMQGTFFNMGLTNMVELFFSYTTVLVVFISTTNPPG